MVEVNTDKDSTVYSFTRESMGDKIFVIFNMSNLPVNVKLTGEVLAGRYKELFTGEKIVLKSSANMRLGAWGYKVFVK